MKIKNQYEKLIAVILTTSIIVTSFSSLVQISAQTEEGTSIQVAQLTASEEVAVQTASRPVEPTKEFMISNENNFTEFMTNPELWKSNVKVNLACDIDMKGKVFNPIKEFNGVFDGCGHIISNLKIQDKSSKSKNSELAFINTLNEFAEIKNVTLDSYNIEGKSGVNKASGFIVTNHGTISNIDIINSSINNIDKKAKSAGFVLNNDEDGTIESCHIENVTAKDTMIKAGFVFINSGKIANSKTTLSVSSKDIAGGFVSENYGIIEGSNFKGSVESKECAGGFCGINAGEISYCKSDGNVTAKTKSVKTATICGGFVGENSGIIKESSANGKIEGQEFTGGFVGINSDKGEISSCKAKCDVKSHTHVASIYCGGFVGLGAGKMENCSFNGTVDGCVDGEKLLGGIIGATVGVISIFSILFMGLIICCNIDSIITILDDDDCKRPINKLLYKLTGLDTVYKVYENYVIYKLFRRLRNPIIFKRLHDYIKTKLKIPNDNRDSPLAPIRLGLILIAIIVPIEGLIIGLTAGQKCAYVGGFAGCTSGEIIKCSANISSITAKTLYNKHNVCGGFVGINGETGTIKYSSATGNEIHNQKYTDGNLGGFVGENFGKIENGTTTVSVTNGKCTGGFCGNNSGEISGSRSEGNATAHSTTKKTKCGGFVGNNEKGVISDCTATGSATGQEYVGGFAGINKSEINGCNATRKATAKTKINNAFAGGFVGENEKGKITGCKATGGAYAKSSLGDAKSGGFVGINKASIIASQANGAVYLSTGVFYKDTGCGGFVGRNDQGGHIDGCYAECKLETTNKKDAGGFVGEAGSKSAIKNSNHKSIVVKKTGIKNKLKFCCKEDRKGKDIIIENCSIN